MEPFLVIDGTNTGLRLKANTNTNTYKNSNTSIPIPILSVDFTKWHVQIYAKFNKNGKISQILQLFVKLDTHNLAFHTNFVQ